MKSINQYLRKDLEEIAKRQGLDITKYKSKQSLYDAIKNKPNNPRMHNPDGVYASEARNEDCFTLRDYFAAKAMQGFIANNQYSGIFSGNNGLPVPEFISEISYGIADAMLKQREL